MHVDSPRPNSTEESSWPDYSIQSDLELTEMIVEYERIKALYKRMGNHLNRVETKIKQVLQASLDKSSILVCYSDMDLISIAGIGSNLDFTLWIGAERDAERYRMKAFICNGQKVIAF